MIAISIESLKRKPLILIDWGNTLMRDAPASLGPMCDWPVVEAMPDAAKALCYMAAYFRVALASGASCSDRAQIIQALKRVELDRWISAIFLASEIGCSKSLPQFYKNIVSDLELAPEQLAMIGNDLVNDVFNARQAGLHAFWVPEVVSKAERASLYLDAGSAGCSTVHHLHSIFWKSTIQVNVLDAPYFETKAFHVH